MTVEIRQLVIRGVVERRPEAAPPAPTVDPFLSFLPPPSASAPHQAPSQAAIVDACVREVLRRLERSRER